MKKKWQVILVFVGVFLAGAVVGSVVSVRYVREMARQRRAPDQFAPQMMKRFAEHLDLTPEQRAKIIPIVNRCSDSIRTLRRQGLSETAALMERMHEDVSRELNGEQREKLNEMRERQRQRFREWTSGRGRDRRSDDRQSRRHPPQNPEMESMPPPPPPDAEFGPPPPPPPDGGSPEPISEPARSE